MAMGMMTALRVLAVGSLLLTAMVLTAADDPATPLPEKPLEIGVKAPAFTLTTLEGTEIGLEAWRGHVVVLNYFITWYRDAARHLGVMETLATKYAPQGLRLLSISLDEGQGGPGATHAFISGHNIAHPVATDPEQQVAGQYGVRALPAIFIIDRDGKVAAYHEGYMEGDDAKIEQMIVAALAAGATDEQPAEAATDEAATDEAPADEEPVCKCFKQSDQE